MRVKECTQVFPLFKHKQCDAYSPSHVTGLGLGGPYCFHNMSRLQSDACKSDSK